MDQEDWHSSRSLQNIDCLFYERHSGSNRHDGGSVLCAQKLSLVDSDIMGSLERTMNASTQAPSEPYSEARKSRVGFLCWAVSKE